MVCMERADGEGERAPVRLVPQNPHAECGSVAGQSNWSTKRNKKKQPKEMNHFNAFGRV